MIEARLFDTCNSVTDSFLDVKTMFYRYFEERQGICFGKNVFLYNMCYQIRNSRSNGHPARGVQNMRVAEVKMLVYETGPIGIMHYLIEKYDVDICNFIHTISTLKYVLPNLGELLRPSVSTLKVV